MKRLILGSLSFLLMSAAVVPAVRAETMAVGPSSLSSASAYTSQLTPFNLAFLAYRGYFKKQGIPSYSALISAYQTGQITTKDVVQGAIKANRLPSQALANQGFLSNVDRQLRGLESGS